MKKAVDPYVLSFESESVRNKRKRHHWMICLAKRPDELVSWGHAPTHELADSAARNELKDLLSGLTQGGHVSQQNHFVPSSRSRWPLSEILRLPRQPASKTRSLPKITPT